MSYPQPPGYQSSYGGPPGSAGGYGSPGYGPPGGGYGPPGYDPRQARGAEILQSARNWLLICALGWFLGFMWITGPLAWYQATQFQRETEGLGMGTPSEVSNLRLFGILTTIFSALMILVGVAALVFVFGAIAFTGVHR